MESEETIPPKPKKNGKFTPEEDMKLKQFVAQFGELNWDIISKYMENRTPRQCKERWMTYLSPKVNLSPWTEEEDQLLMEKYNFYGPKWTRITVFFPSRTEINVRNRCTVLLRRRNRKIRFGQLTKEEKEKLILSQYNVQHPPPPQAPPPQNPPTPDPDPFFNYTETPFF